MLAEEEKFFLLNFLGAGLFGRKSLRKLLIHELDECFWWEWKHLDAFESNLYKSRNAGVAGKKFIFLIRNKFFLFFLSILNYEEFKFIFAR